MRRLVGALSASVVLVAFAVALPARTQEKKPETPQEKKPEPAAPAVQQDRANITGTLDSWYRITQRDKNTQQDKPVGFVHEKLDPMGAGSPWKYNYTLDGEAEWMVPDLKEIGKEIPTVQSVRVNGKLDDTYAPVDWEETDHLNGVDLNSRVTLDESGARQVEVFLSATDRKTIRVPADEEVYFTRSLMFISLRQNNVLSRPGERRVSLFFPQTEGKPPVAEVVLDIGPMLKREYMGKKEVSVTQVRYRKPPPAMNRDMELAESYIDKFGRIVEDVYKGDMRRVLVAGEVEAVGKGGSLRIQGRRDPFRKDFAMTLRKAGKAEGEGERKGKEIKVDPEMFEKNLAEAIKLIDELKKAKDEGRDSDAEGFYQRILDYHSALKKSLQVKPQSQENMAKVDRLRQQAEEIWGGAERLAKKLKETYAKALDHFNREECEDLAKLIDELKKALVRKELQETRQLLELGQWIADLEPRLGKCKTRLELARRKIVLSGTALYEDWVQQPLDVSLTVFGHQVGGFQSVRFVKPSRQAVINGKVYRVGDMVEGEGVRVEKIWAHGVQVSLRDETRDVGIRQ